MYSLVVPFLLLSLTHQQTYINTLIEDMPSYQTYNGQRLKVYFASVSNIYQIALKDGGEVKPPITLLRQGQMTYPNLSDGGCFAVQSYLSAEPAQTIPFFNNITGSALLVDLACLVLTTKDKFYTLSMNFPDTVVGYTQSEFDLSVRLDNVTLIQTIDIAAQVGKRFLLINQLTQTLYVLGQTSSLVLTNYTSLSGDVPPVFAPFTMKINQTFSACLYFQLRFICNTPSAIYVYNITNSGATQTQVITTIGTSNATINIIKVVTSSDIMVQSFYVVDSYSGVYRFDLQSPTNYGVGKQIFVGDDVINFGSNTWGYVVQTRTALYDFFYVDNILNWTVNNIQPLNGNFSGLLYNDRLMILQSEHVYQVRKPNQFYSLNSNASTVIYTDTQSAGHHYEKYGRKSYILTVGQQDVLVTLLDDQPGHVECLFDDEDSHATTYTVNLLSKDCNNKATVSLSPMFVCNTTQTFLVKSERTYVGSKRLNLAIGLGLGIPLIVLLLSILAYCINSKRQMDLRRKPNKKYPQSLHKMGSQHKIGSSQELVSQKQLGSSNKLGANKQQPQKNKKTNTLASNEDMVNISVDEKILR